MSDYPQGYEPYLFLLNACKETRAEVVHAPIETEEGTLPGFVCNGRQVVYLLDNRMPANQWQNPAAKKVQEEDGVLVCCAQYVDAIQQEFQWIPLGVTPAYISPQGKRKPKPAYDFAFVGYLNDLPRQSVIERMQGMFLHNVQSQIFGDDAIAVYRSAKVGLNITAFFGSPYAYDANMRMFEIPATGVPLLTPYVPGMIELGFRHGINCMKFEDAIELKAHIETLCANSQLRAEIGKAGHKLVMEKHLYKHRAQQLIEVIDGGT